MNPFSSVGKAVIWLGGRGCLLMGVYLLMIDDIQWMSSSTLSHINTGLWAS